MVDTIAATAAATPQTSSESSVVLSEDFDTFLTLLTEQLRNQDPLNPTDATEFTNQLVQFAGLEQEILQNENLTRLQDGQNITLVNTAANMVGADAAFIGPQAPLADGQARWRYEAAATPASVSISIRDGDDKEVFETTLPGADGPQEYTWDGLDQDGEPLAEGLYTAVISATDADDEAIAVEIAGFSRATAVDFTGDEPALVVDGRARSLDEVVELAP